MKKFYCCFLSILILLSLSACGGAEVPMANFNALSDKYSELQTQFDELNANYNDLQKEFDKLTENDDTLLQKLNDLQQAYNNLQSEYDSYKQKMEPYEALDAAEAQARQIEAERILAEQKAAEEAAAAEAAAALAEEEAKGYETGITYNDLARRPDEYVDKKVKFTGKVLQVLEGDGYIQIRLAINSDYDKVVFCEYDPSIVDSRILDDDIITIYGVSIGTITYQSTMGGPITIPGILIDRIDQ